MAKNKNGNNNNNNDAERRRREEEEARRRQQKQNNNQKPTQQKPTPISVQQISNKNTLNQNLRAAAGAGNVLSERELLKISKGRDPEKVLEKAVNKGLMIGSKVVNQYQQGKYDTKGLSAARQALPAFAMAAGMDSNILRKLREAGRQDKGSALFIGSKGSTATTLPRGLGGGTGRFNQPGTAPAPELDPVDTFNDPVQPMDTPMDPLPPEEPQAASGPGMMSGGGDGLGGATKLNRAKSRLRQLGIYGRGTGLLGRGLQYGNALNA